MANSFKRAMALTLAAAMVATAVPATNFGTISADAASYKVTGTTAPYAKTTNKYVIKGLKKGMYAKVSITGNAKSKVTVKQGSKKIKASTKINGTGKNITLKVTNKAAAGKKYNVVVKYFNKKGKQVKKITKKATVYAQTTSVTITPVTGAAITGASINVTGASIQVGTSITLTAAKTPEKNTKKITWKTSDAKVASVANGVVTAVGAGKATITATSGKASASYEVTVDDSNVAAKIVASGSKQTAADKITLAFDKDAKSLTKNDITVERDDKTATIPVKEVNFAADGKSAEVVLFSALQDKKTYVVSQSKDSDNFTFEAKVGAPASFLVKTANAERGVETKIEYSILDDTGMDVTAAVQDIKSVVSASLKDGSVVDSHDFDKSNNLKIKFAKVGDTATVVLKYNNDTTKSTFTQEAVITCVEATEKKGTPLFMQTDDAKLINDESECASFYKTTTASSVWVNVGATREDVYFCALDKNGDAINYESYEISSGNDDYLSTSAIESEGKFAKISITGNKKGNTVINVKATVNGVASNYTIPVVVKSEKKLSDLKLSLSRTKLTNAYDLAYTTVLDVKAYDTNGDEIKGDDFDSSNWSSEIVDADKKANVLDDNADAYFVKNKVPTGEFGFNKIDEDEYSAWGAKDGSYKIKVSATVGDVTKEKEISVSVSALDKKVYTENVALKYEVELLNKDFKPMDGTTFDEDDNHNGYALLAAKFGTAFVGYVRQAYFNGDYVTWIGSATKEYGDSDNEAASVAVVSGMTFTSTTSDAGLNGITFAIESASAVSAEAILPNKLKFEVGPNDGREYAEGVKIAICSNGVTVADHVDVRTDSAGTDSDAYWIVQSGTTVYVNIYDVGQTVDVTSADVVKNEIETLITADDVFAQTGNALGTAAGAGLGWFAKAVMTSVGTAGNGVFTVPNVYAIEEDDLLDVVTFYYDPVDAAVDPDAVAEAFNEKKLDVDEDGKLENPISAQFVAATTTGAIKDSWGITEGGDSGMYGADGIVEPTLKTDIWNISAGIKDGSGYYSDGDLFNFGVKGAGKNQPVNGHDGASFVGADWYDELFAGLFADSLSEFVGADWYNELVADSISIVGLPINTKDTDTMEDPYYVVGDSTNDLYFAKTGSYDVRFEYRTNREKSDTKGNQGEDANAHKNIKVENKMYIPKVTVVDRFLSDLGTDTIKDALKVDVDLNNEDGANESIKTDMKKEFKLNGYNKSEKEDNDASISESNGKVFVKYVPVKEEGVIIYIPISTTFEEEK